MLFNYILLAVNTVFTLSAPVCAYFAFARGYRAGYAAKAGRETPAASWTGEIAQASRTARASRREKRREKREKDTRDEIQALEQRKLCQLLSNLETYNGSAENQKEVIR